MAAKRNTIKASEDVKDVFFNVLEEVYPGAGSGQGRKALDKILIDFIVGGRERWDRILYLDEAEARKRFDQYRNRLHGPHAIGEFDAPAAAKRSTPRVSGRKKAQGN